MFWIICVVFRDRYNPLALRLTSVRLWAFLFGLFHSLRSPSYRKLIEQLAAGRSGLPHERIEQRQSSISPSEKTLEVHLSLLQNLDSTNRV